jgi:demethylmenaquinone methyltransferase/2-methoxy-6-polyprenyl-1,4-benzoquinol methylase
MGPNYKIQWLFYDLLEVVYFNRKKHSPRTALINLIPDKPVSVLDLCAGTCSNSVLIAKNKPKSEVTALDLSAEMLKIAEKKFRKQGIDNVKISIGDARRTHFDDNSFDVILLSLVLHEMSEDLQKEILYEAKRVLRDNGRIIVIEWEQPTKLMQRIVFSTIKPFEPKVFKAFLKMDLSVYFKKLGFNVDEKMNGKR